MRRPFNAPTTKTVGQLRQILFSYEEGLPVYLIINGVSYPIDMIWKEPHQAGEGKPAVCLGDDPR